MPDQAHFSFPENMQLEAVPFEYPVDMEFVKHAWSAFKQHDERFAKMYSVCNVDGSVNGNNNTNEHSNDNIREITSDKYYLLIAEVFAAFIQSDMALIMFNDDGVMFSLAKSTTTPLTFYTVEGELPADAVSKLKTHFIKNGIQHHQFMYSFVPGDTFHKNLKFEK